MKILRTAPFILILAVTHFACDRSRVDTLAAARDRGDLPAVEAILRRDFTDVPQITTDGLAARLGDTAAPPLLLDVRSEEEFAISHLAGARRVDLDGDPAAQLADVERTRAIVVYCSVGYRSSLFARRLQNAGFFNVVNLEGSIFRWAIEDRPLVNETGRTDRVHPYDRSWATMLPESKRASGKLDG